MGDAGRSAAGAAGDKLLEEVFELLCERLPSLGHDDPVRRELQPVLPELARRLGRPAVVLAPVAALAAAMMV